jgi:rare lipoprotein A
MRQIITPSLVVALYVTSLGAASGPNNSGSRNSTSRTTSTTRTSTRTSITEKTTSRNDDLRTLIAQAQAARKRGTFKSNQVGTASWYGEAFDGKPTASGERYNMYQLTAAHLSLPLGTRVRVTNLKNGRNVVVRINDRGPYIPGRMIDLSYRAARVLEFKSQGITRVRMEVLQPRELAASRSMASLQ